MGYACPVCEIPHQDATHLANHLAFTAMTHGDDHEAWLDDNVPGWAESGETELAGEVAELAPEAEYDQVFEDTVGARGGVGGDSHAHGHDHREGPPGGVDPETAAVTGRSELDEAARAVLDEARALTAEMFDEGETGAADAEAGDGGDDVDAGRDAGDVSDGDDDNDADRDAGDVSDGDDADPGDVSGPDASGGGD